MFRCSAEIHIKFLPFFDVCWLHHIFPHVMQVSIARKKETAMTPYFSGQAKQLADHIRLWSYFASRLKVSNWGKLPLPSTYIYYVLLYSIIFKGCRPCRRPRKNRQGSQANWHKNSSVLRTLRLSTFFLCILL